MLCTQLDRLRCHILRASGSSPVPGDSSPIPVASGERSRDWLLDDGTSNYQDTDVSTRLHAAKVCTALLYAESKVVMQPQKITPEGVQDDRRARFPFLIPAPEPGRGLPCWCDCDWAARAVLLLPPLIEGGAHCHRYTHSYSDLPGRRLLPIRPHRIVHHSGGICISMYI